MTDTLGLLLDSVGLLAACAIALYALFKGSEE